MGIRAQNNAGSRSPAFRFLIWIKIQAWLSHYRLEHWRRIWSSGLVKYVMAGLVPAIHVYLLRRAQNRGRPAAAP
jgi:hypothetical protein